MEHANTPSISITPSITISLQKINCPCQPDSFILVSVQGSNPRHFTSAFEISNFFDIPWQEPTPNEGKILDETTGYFYSNVQLNKFSGLFSTICYFDLNLSNSKSIRITWRSTSKNSFVKTDFLSVTLVLKSSNKGHRYKLDMLNGSLH